MDQWDPDRALEARRRARAEARRHRARVVRRQRIGLASVLALVVCAVVLGLTHSSGSATPHDAGRVGNRGSPQPGRPPFDVRGEAARRMRVPILMYHVIGTPPAGVASPGLWVTASAFREQMIALRQAGYRGVSLHRAVDGLQYGGALPRKPVVVSFDDGYRGDYTAARPILRSLGWPGVLNLELDNIRTGDITAAEVRGLVHAGWEIDSHTFTHPDLTKVDETRLHEEVVDSRRELQREFRVPSDFFCYPSGRYDARVVKAVRNAGYVGATTTADGDATSASPFTMPRIRVTPGDSPRSLLSRIQ